MAQRVMDCGDAGHILLSKHVAEDLEQDERWRPLLHDLGELPVRRKRQTGPRFEKLPLRLRGIDDS